jgi:hypothetical protein
LQQSHFAAVSLRQSGFAAILGTRPRTSVRPLADPSPPLAPGPGAPPPVPSEGLCTLIRVETATVSVLLIGVIVGAVLGAGAVGGVVGGRLALAGARVVLVARGAHLAAMRARGLLP